MAERAAFRVLACQAHVVAIAQQGRKRQRFCASPVDVFAPLNHLAALFHDLGDVRMRREAVGDRVPGRTQTQVVSWAHGRAPIRR